MQPRELNLADLVQQPIAHPMCSAWHHFDATLTLCHDSALFQLIKADMSQVQQDAACRLAACTFWQQLFPVNEHVPVNKHVSSTRHILVR